MTNKKITKLNAYSPENTLENIRGYKRKKTIRRRLTLMTIFSLSLIVLAAIPILRNIQAANKYNAEAVELTEKLTQAENEKQSLEYEVALLEDDEYIAKLARKELNFSKANEILINLPEDKDESEESEDSEELDETEE